MITVGIQSNIRLLEALINDKGTLILKAQQDAGGGSLLDILSSSSTLTQENDQDYYFWPIQEDERLQSETEKYKDILNKLTVLRAQLNHLLEQYTLSTNIKWDITKGLGFKEETQSQDLTEALMNPAKREGVLGQIYNNYVTQFVAQISPFLGPSSPLFRMKLPRTSKDKHFSSIPKFAPFIEPMTIPAVSSKLKWSRYELGFRKGDPEKGPYSGLNYSDPSPVEGAAAAVAKGNPAEADAVANLFGVKN